MVKELVMMAMLIMIIMLIIMLLLLLLMMMMIDDDDGDVSSGVVLLALEDDIGDSHGGDFENLFNLNIHPFFIVSTTHSTQYLCTVGVISTSNEKASTRGVVLG
ncbi:hypothetical protein PoB_004177400 [Plakobranchus ocellatus]|uniref:Uncharacterized protein n=1 Tax=Plakobranchus ocellatus TaxID=259542 RepID=A0AAV4BA74_9GAST|nr:hypothetical protein PoB_004177400 [Plakobranchus ocellatus]